MKQLIRKFKQISILILAIFIVGCEQDDAALPKITAGFTYKINLNSGTVTFINISENAQTYEWSFGDDNKTSKDVNPIHTYPTSGTYTVILKAKNASGATETFESDITFTLIDKVVLPITFDISTVGYDAATFNGASFAIVANPSVSGTNNKASKVGAITNSGKAFEGINFDLGAPIDLTIEKSIKMNFWANAPITVLMKLEEGATSTPDVVVNHTGTGWEEMIFSFTSSSKYSRLTLFVDGPGTKAGTFYFDDVTQIATPLPPCTAETAQSLLASNFNLTFQADPSASIVKDGGDFEWINNPDISGALNKSCKVGKIVRSASLQYANTQINVASAFDFNTKSGFKMKVWSPAVGTKVTVKLEGGTVVEVSKNTTKANEWEELTFDFPSTAAGNKKIVLFFNIDSFTTGTFYIDDFMLYGTGSGGGGACTADAAQSLTAAGFNLTFASNPGTMATKGEAVGKFLQDGTTYTYVDNPGTSALNNSCKVGKVKNNNQNPWDNIQIDLANKLTLTDGSNFKMKIYAPQSGYKVTLKLEDKASGGAINSGDKPSTTSTTLTNGWEELTFNVGAGDSGKYDKIVLFFDLQSQNGNTYYFDDLKLNLGTGSGTGGGGTGTTSGIANNGDFETGTLAGWAVYPNGGIVIADNTQNNGGSWSGKLVASPTGLNPTLKQERKGAGTVKAGDRIQIKFDYKGSSAGGGIYSMQSFVEAANGVSQTENISVTPTATWQTFTRTYTVGAGDASGGITMEFVAICGGVAGCSSTLYLDNVSITINP